MHERTGARTHRTLSRSAPQQSDGTRWRARANAEALVTFQPNLSGAAVSSTLTRFDMYILDALGHDAETIDAIVSYINEHPDADWVFGRKYTRGDAVSGLTRLIRDGSVGVSIAAENGEDAMELPAGELPPGNFSAAMYSMTPRGTLRYLNWED